MADQDGWLQRLGILDWSRRLAALATPDSGATMEPRKPRVLRFWAPRGT